jgi:hypothetical protein
VLRTLLILLALALPSAAKQVTLRIPLEPGTEPEEIAVVTFDDSRISPADVKRSMLLHEDGYYATPAIGAYGECKAEDVARMERDIHTAGRTVEELDPQKFPAELSDVVIYLNKLQSFWLWQARQELAFLKSGTAPDTEFTGIDLDRCRVHPQTLPETQACKQVFYNWHNCTNKTVREQLGEYPKQAWKAFLDAYGIRERIESTVDD